MSIIEELENLSKDELKRDSVLSEISELAELQKTLQLKVKNCEDALKKANEQLRKVSQDSLPELMNSIGMKSFSLSTGETISIKDKWTASITGGKKQFVINWLKQNNHNDLLSDTISIPFKKGNEKQAELLHMDLQERGYLAIRNEDVNTASFKSLCRELVEVECKDIPLKELGVFVIKIAEIK